MSPMTDLFIEKPVLTFERPKRAGIEVDENPQTWSRQVLSELYRQVPDIAEYTPTVMFMKVDEEQGYALGAVIIANVTDSALATTQVTGASKKALIPIVIKNHKLAPMDIILTPSGKMYPLTGARLRQTLFRPDTFDMVTEDYADSSLWNMFYPPGRSDNTYGAGISQGVDGGTAGAVTFINGPGMKLSGARFEMLEGIVGPSLLGPDLDRLVDLLDSDAELKKVAFASDTMSAALQILASFEGTAVRSPDGLLKAAAASSSPAVIQLGHDERGYWAKSASRSAFFHGEPEYMGRRDFLKIAGEEVAQKVDMDGTVTLSLEPVVDTKVDPSASKWALIEEPGIYKVKTISGKEMTGWVLPNLLDTDGTRVPMTVFTNGAAATIQSQVVGARVATGVDLPAGPAKGTGLFYVAGQGGVEATVPLVISGREAGMDGGDSYLVRTLGGEESRVRIVPGLVTMRALGKEIMLPPSAKFLPLDKEAMVKLVETVDGLAKTAGSVLERGVRIIGEGDRFQVDFTNLPKLASMFPRHLTHDQAMMALCLGGLSAPTAETKLAASSRGAVKVAGLVDIRTAHELLEASRAKAAADSKAIRALRQDLVKEATVLPDVMTVDSVLSLGFINSENIRMFVSRLPYLEKALSMVCELILASRLGFNEIPESAAGRCARGLDDVIQGLQALSMRSLEGTAEGG